MRTFIRRTVSTAVLGMAMAGVTNAAEIMVTSNISVSETWTADNTYNLQDQIYVLPGATLTIEGGTVVASTTGIGGSLAVANGAQIFVKGTALDPVVMTSKADVATWTKESGIRRAEWREGVNEWGNLTIMGDGYCSENATTGNTAVPSPSNVAQMEGLTADFVGDTKVLYGGGNDDDDSGSISYLSIRYGGRVIGLNNELNGLSLGALGRETDIHHVEIMNNVDDGIEIWGGAVNVKNFAIWFIGDDSFDVDQGWRGQAQFGLIVQGYSTNDSQGSGFGDNAFETDGAEDSDWQPVTTAKIYNCTVVGQPIDGDRGTAWRDGARVQYRNCVFMDLGEDLVREDGSDGDGAQGYGHNGTLTFDDTWTTDWNQTSTVNPFPGTPLDFYQAQTDGKLSEVKDSVFFRNLEGGGTGMMSDPAYTEAIAQGVFDSSNNNVFLAGFVHANRPIRRIVRGPLLSLSGFAGKLQIPVTRIDPMPRGPAMTSVDVAPDNGFFTSAKYRGAFSPSGNWLCGWSAADEMGFLRPCGLVSGRPLVPAVNPTPGGGGGGVVVIK